MSFLVYPTIKQSPMLSMLGMGGGGTGTAFGGGAAYEDGEYRYWKYELDGSSGGNHHPNVSRLGFAESRGGTVTNFKVYNGDNCSDTGSFAIGSGIEYDHGSTAKFERVYLYSVYNGGYRSAYYKVSGRNNPSDPWTQVWRGIAHNQNGWVCNNDSQCGLIEAHGYAQRGPNPNDGTDWTTHGTYSLSSGGWDGDGPHAAMFNGNLWANGTQNRSQTGGNYITVTWSGLNFEILSSFEFFSHQVPYTGTVWVTIDGTEYSSSGSRHIFTQKGTISQIKWRGNGTSGRTYAYGMILNGYQLIRNSNGGT